LNVLQSFVEDPHTSINRVTQQHEIGVASVHKILKKKKMAAIQTPFDPRII